MHNGLEGLGYGAKSFGLGLAEGISGVFVQPVKMAMREGVGGFFKGIGMGEYMSSAPVHFLRNQVVALCLFTIVCDEMVVSVTDT